ncbi:MAG: dihydrofolate reductase family protein [Candidatus Limnocylindria bacterium]
MGKVVFLMNVSLDGYIEARDRALDWSVRDDELLEWFNERMRSFETIVYGRRLFEVMDAHWPTAESDPTLSGPRLEFARIWNAAPKVVVSNTMQEAPAGWRLTRGDPASILEELRRDVSGDIEIGGPTLAADFIRRGLVDEYALVIHPVILGGGTPWFPDLERPARLRLLESRTFSSGVVILTYAAR